MPRLEPQPGAGAEALMRLIMSLDPLASLRLGSEGWYVSDKIFTMGGNGRLNAPVRSPQQTPTMAVMARFHALADETRLVTHPLESEREEWRWNGMKFEHAPTNARKKGRVR